MAKLKNLLTFFKTGTPNPATSISQLKPEISQHNDFTDSDLEKEVIEVGTVIAVEAHPRGGWFKVKLPKRGNDKSFPGFSFHSKYFIDYNAHTEKLNIFENDVTIMSEVGGVEKKEKVKAKDVYQIYGDVNSRMITYTDDHSI